MKGPRYHKMEAIADKYRAKGWKFKKLPYHSPQAGERTNPEDFHLYEVTSPRVKFKWDWLSLEESEMLNNEIFAYADYLGGDIFPDLEIEEAIKKGKKQWSITIPIKSL